MNRVQKSIEWTLSSVAIALVVLSLVAVPSSRMLADDGGGGGDGTLSSKNPCVDNGCVTGGCAPNPFGGCYGKGCNPAPVGCANCACRGCQILAKGSFCDCQCATNVWWCDGTNTFCDTAP